MRRPDIASNSSTSSSPFCTYLHVFNYAVLPNGVYLDHNDLTLRGAPAHRLATFLLTFAYRVRASVRRGNPTHWSVARCFTIGDLYLFRSSLISNNAAPHHRRLETGWFIKIKKNNYVARCDHHQCCISPWATCDIL